MGFFSHPVDAGYLKYSARDLKIFIVNINSKIGVLVIGLKRLNII